MKQLFAILMSLQLILFPIAHVPSAYAEATPTYNPDGPPVGSGAAGDAHYETGLNSTGGYDFYVKQIMVLALGVIGSSILTSCIQGFKVPSVIAYSAGAIALIGSEIFGAKSQNQKHKKDLAHVNMDESKMPKEGGEHQKVMLETSLKEEEDMLGYVKEKRDWMIAITTIWSVASGTAIGEEVYAHAVGTTTGTLACSGGSTKCTLGAAACAAKCVGTMSLGAWGAEAAFMDDQPNAQVATYCAPAADDIAPCQIYAQLYLALAFAGCSKTSLFTSEALNIALNMAIMIAWGLALGQVDGGGDISTYGMMLFGLLSLVSSTVSKVIVASYNYPIPRSIIFAAHAVLGGVVIAGLEDRIEAAESNVEKLKRVIKDFKVLSTGGEEVVEAPEGDTERGQGPDLSESDGDVEKLADGKKARKDIGCLGENRKHGPDECKKPLRIKPTKWELGDGLDTFKDVNNKATDFANATSAGDMEKARSLAADIASKAGKVREINEKLRKKYNDKLKAEGKAPIDFDKRIKEQVAGLQKVFDDSAKAKGFGPSTYAGAGKASIDLDKTADKKTEPKGNLGAKTDAKGSAKNPLADMGLETTSSGSEFETPTEINKTGAGIDQFDTQEADVHKQKEASIFALISNRYVRSYDRVMKKKDAPKGPPGEDPKKSAKE